MSFYNKFANIILLVACIAYGTSLFSTQIDPISEPTINISVTKMEGNTQYTITLYQPCSTLEVGQISFSFNKDTQTAYIHQLHIYQTERKKSYGSILLTFALETLRECKATAIYWTASPFNLISGQDYYEMLTKLIAFYQRHGAQVMSFSGNSAQMAYYP